MTNLADNLTKTAEEHPDRPAVRLDDMVLTYAELQDGARRVAALLTDKGVGPGDRVGLVLPNVPPFPVLFYGALAVGRGRRTDEPAAQGPRGEVLPRGLRRQDRLRLEGHGRGGRQGRRGGRHRVHRASSPAASLDLLGPARARPTRSSTATDDDTVVLLYTSGTTGQPKGAELTHANMITNAAVSAETLVELDRGGRRDGLPAPVPLLRADLRAQRRRAQGRLPDPHPPLRRDQGARGRGPRQGHRLRGRPDDVRRDAAREDADVVRHVEPAHLHLRRLRDAGRGDEEASRRPSTASCSRATGSPRPRRSPRSTSPTSSASPARSASPSAASR